MHRVVGGIVWTLPRMDMAWFLRELTDVATDLTPKRRINRDQDLQALLSLTSLTT